MNKKVVSLINKQEQTVNLFILLAKKEYGNITDERLTLFINQYTAFSQTHLTENKRFILNDMLVLLPLWHRYSDIFEVLLPPADSYFQNLIYPSLYWGSIVQLLVSSNLNINYIKSVIYIYHLYYRQSQEANIELKSDTYEAIRCASKSLYNNVDRINITFKEKMWYWPFLLVQLELQKRQHIITTTLLMKVIPKSSKMAFKKNKEKHKKFITTLLQKISDNSIYSLTDTLLGCLYFIHEHRPDFFTKKGPNSLVGDTGLKLLNNLFEGFTLPAMLAYHFCNWSRLTTLEKQWIKQILKGESIRFLKDSPISISKNMSAILMELVPSRKLSFENCIIVAALMNKGLPQDDAEKISNETLYRIDLTYFVETAPILYNRLVDKTRFTEYWDFLSSQTTQQRAQIDISTINIDRLNQLVQEWHNEIVYLTMRGRRNIFLPNADIAVYEFQAADGSKRIIRQLLNTYEVELQGMKQRNCVATYIPKLKTKSSFIFSLDKFEDKKQVPLLTIEVSSRRKIVQIRSKFNALPTAEELSWIKDWAQRVELDLPDGN